MVRTSDSSMIAASQAGVVQPIIFVEFQFDSGTTRYCSHDRNVVWSGYTWTGVGALGKISALEESHDVRPSGISLGVSGLPAANLALALSEPYSGRTVRIWQGFYDATHEMLTEAGDFLLLETADNVVLEETGTGGTTLLTPVLMFEGYMDQMSIVLGDTAEITVTAENKLSRWDVPRESRFTNAEQQELFPGDKGFEFVAQTVEKEIVWGTKSSFQIPISQAGATTGGAEDFNVVGG